jgi:hypothetical protein
MHRQQQQQESVLDLVLDTLSAPPASSISSAANATLSQQQQQPQETLPELTEIPEHQRIAGPEPPVRPLDTKLEDWLKLFECPICMNLFLEPATIACSHTFCSSCLAAALRHTPSCPVCRASCHTNSTARHVNTIIDQAMLLAIPPALLLARARPDAPASPATLKIPLFILQPSLFMTPGQAIYLRVFEPRYRLLMQRCVEHGTRFGLQAGYHAGRGVLVRVDNLQQTPGGDLIMAGMIEGRYQALTPATSPEQEPHTHGLNVLESMLVEDEPAGDQQELRALANTARAAIAARFAALEQSSIDGLRSQHGEIPASPAQLSFWLLNAISMPSAVRNAVLYDRAFPLCAVRVERRLPAKCD